MALATASLSLYGAPIFSASLIASTSTWPRLSSRSHLHLSRTASRRHYATPVNPSSSVDHRLHPAMRSEDEAGGSTPSRLSQASSKLKQAQSPLERRGNPFPASSSSTLPSSPSRAQPAPPINPETPHSPTVPSTRPHTLDARILSAARALATAHERGSAPFAGSTLRNLLRSFEAKANIQLPICLPYEPTPNTQRRVSAEDDDDGVLLIAYVSGLDQPNAKISVCSGFAVQGAEPLRRNGAAVGDGELLITCAHTLRACLPDTPAMNDAGRSNSVALALTRSGAAYPVQGLLSSLPSSDLILLQLGSTPLLPRDERSSSPSPSVSAVDVFSYAPADSPQPPRSLPVSPYPSPVGTVLRVSSFFGWESPADSTASAAAIAGHRTLEAGLTEEDAETARRRARWGRARLVEYKDRMGHEARTGTYDELSQLDFKLLQPEESLKEQDSHAPPTDRSSPYARHPDAAVVAAGLGFAATSGDMHSHLSPANYAPLPSAAQDQKQSQLLLNFPPPGSSGGPIIEEATGAVVGVVRGCRMSQLEGRRGDAVPAEKVFEFFSLPGLGKV